MTERLRNWAGNYAYAAARVHRPETVEQVQEIVARGRRVKALGSRHSFNGVADTEGDLVALDRLPRTIEVDRARGTVTVDGGARYGDLCGPLAAEGLALHNLASLPHISVAGACATATHGSGDEHGNLATAVTAIELVRGDGERVTLARGRDADFPGAVVALGALGVVVRLTLELRPAYEVRQDVYEGLPLDRLDDDFEAIASSGYSVSLFTDWRASRFEQVWLKRRVVAGEPADTAPEFFGARRATGPRHPIAGHPVEHCTAQLGAPGAWHDRLPHFRLDHTPSSGAELQSDYLVPRRHAVAALREVEALRDRIAPLLLVSEVRTVAADDLWLSPCHAGPVLSIHFTWKQDWPGVAALLPSLESRLLPLGARPHWGKLFTVPPPHVRALYPRLPDFRRLAERLDSAGKFRNAFLDAYVFAEL